MHLLIHVGEEEAYQYEPCSRVHHGWEGAFIGGVGLGSMTASFLPEATTFTIRSLKTGQHHTHVLTQDGTETTRRTNITLS
jgi:hypothetical protein